MSNDPKTLLRCAIYTRKSSEEGLKQSFNSLPSSDFREMPCLLQQNAQLRERVVRNFESRITQIPCVLPC
jgi:hypothetical protein